MIVSAQLIACFYDSVTPLTMGSEGSKKRKIESAKPVQDQQPTFENATDTPESATDTSESATDTYESATDTSESATDTPESATDTYESATDTSEKNDNGESSFYFHH